MWVGILQCTSIEYVVPNVGFFPEKHIADAAGAPREDMEPAREYHVEDHYEGAMSTRYNIVMYAKRGTGSHGVGCDKKGRLDLML